MEQRSILITGCSSGIGLASAREMKARGWRVFATARKPEDIKRLRDQIGVDSLSRDYAEPASIAAAAEQVLAATGGTLSALFNNGAMASRAPSRICGQKCCAPSSKRMCSAGTTSPRG
jgi:NAD(P)-dependent dehydrogenase (short-subunit alcohol dehydrogenase family)